MKQTDLCDNLLPYFESIVSQFDLVLDMLYDGERVGDEALAAGRDGGQVCGCASFKQRGGARGHEQAWHERAGAPALDTSEHNNCIKYLRLYSNVCSPLICIKKSTFINDSWFSKIK